MYNKRTINVCFASDKNYAEHLAVAICSLIENADINDFVNIYILHEDIPPEVQAKISLLENSKISKINFMQMDLKIFNDCYIPSSLYFSKAIFYRLKAPTIFKNLDKLIYLDTDLVIRDSLQELYNIDINDYYFAAVNDLFGSNEKVNNINSGVLLLNLAKMRNDNIEKDLLELVTKYETVCPDQHALNVACKDKIYLLNLKWNSQHTKVYRNFYVKQKTAKKDSTIILHFVGKCKPWQNKGHFTHKIIYYYYLNKTVFASFKTKYLQWFLNIVTAFFTVYREDNYYRYRILTFKGKLYLPKF